MSTPWIGADDPTSPGARWWEEIVATDVTIRWWDGSALQNATLVGLWTGSGIEPITINGWWDGSVMQPLV